MKKYIVYLFMVISSVAYGGSQEHKDSEFKPEQVIRLAKNVERYAASQGAYAFIIARQGRPESDLPQGIHYTHTAIAVYSEIVTSDGSKELGYAIHNLYQQAEAPGVSRLVTDYPVDFFWGANKMKAGIIIPSFQLQQRLVALFANEHAAKLHVPNYSVIANPYTLSKQNCTEYTLDLINAAIYQTTDLKRLKRNTQAYYRAHPVKVSGLKLSLASAFSSGISIKDHPKEIVTATFGSIAEYLKEFGLVEQVAQLGLDSLEVLYEKGN